MAKEIMTASECAEYLGIKESTLSTWINTRNLPCRSIGKLYRFRLSEINAWFDGLSAEKISGSRGDGYKYLKAWRKKKAAKEST